MGKFYPKKNVFPKKHRDATQKGLVYGKLQAKLTLGQWVMVNNETHHQLNFVAYLPTCDSFVGRHKTFYSLSFILDHCISLVRLIARRP